jgi:methionyl aminopeptidase
MIHLKTPFEIDQIEYSNRLLAELLQICYEYIKPGIATVELEEIAKKFCSDNNVRPSFKGYKGFPYCICASVNEEVVHGFPNERKIRSGDIVSIDCGIDRNGYYSDSAFTKIVGKVPKIVEKLVKTTKECLYKGIEKAVHNGRLNDVSSTIQSIAENAGFGVVREFTGHGVGFDVHEEPKIPNYVSDGVNHKLKVGMVMAIEPMLTEGSYDVKVGSDGWIVTTKDGKMAAHWEHSIAILPDGPRILSKW